MPRVHKRPQFQAKANVPMATETRDRLALEVRMAGESLIARPSIDAYNTLSKILASLNRAGLTAQLLDPVTDTMNVICDRYEQSSSITVETQETAQLRQALANVDAGLHRVPLQRLARAVAEVEAFFVISTDGPQQ
ncbi:hypothetical protein [Massilia yuzhufengensis]|uniref:Uncharacterized protein n=1 Tax=Massilia yuzhufengensis TaxID=1164594 RepID=A0A1I1VMF3_9BURK|nr:hypothetical protein [Massilia yuzhufengensis]SFD84197.1 hypothetical protein SAMN05216204_14048 [Massilia yuzhufengensis]